MENYQHSLSSWKMKVAQLTQEMEVFMNSESTDGNADSSRRIAQLLDSLREVLDQGITQQPYSPEEAAILGLPNTQ